MKKVFATFLLAVAFAGTSFAQSKTSDVARFDTESVQMGTLKQNVPSTATFTVTNVSKKDLVIESASASCGCTKPEYTVTPIKPGKTGYVKATYNAAGVGSFNKAVSVKFAGVDGVVALAISGVVEAPAETKTN
jgi:hypothetical protein